MLSPVVFSMVMGEIRRRISQWNIRNHGLQHDIIILELNKSTLEAKFHRIVTICKDLMPKT
jgi:hypothetical protein